MSLLGTGYQVALLRELARLNVLIAGITEARLPGSGCSYVDTALLLHSGGDQRMSGVALMVRPPFAKSLTLWKPIFDQLLSA